jgi:hypothetical protein
MGEPEAEGQQGAVQQLRKQQIDFLFPTEHI